jgi:ribosomal protein L32E
MLDFKLIGENQKVLIITKENKKAEAVQVGLHPSGYTDNLVYNLGDLEKLDPKKDGVRFAHGVGTRKRKEIIVKAIEQKFKIFNARVSASGSKS